MDNDAKIRPYYLGKVLYERTDERHFLTTEQLRAILLEEYGIHSHRQTIATEIELLKSFGMDIRVQHSRQNRYFIGSRKFGTAELKLLIDAVSSSKFITASQSRTRKETRNDGKLFLIKSGIHPHVVVYVRQ